MSRKKEPKLAPDKVVRIDNTNYARIKALGANDEKKRTLNELLGFLLDTAEPVINGELRYATVLFDDPADARGDAIVRAARAREIPDMPSVVVVIGKDSL